MVGPAVIGEFLADVPADRHPMLETVCHWILTAMPPGYEPHLIRGRLSWIAPGGAVYVAVETGRYDCSLYLMHVGACPRRRAHFRKAWSRTGRVPVMNYARLRFRTLTDLDRAILSRTIASTTPGQLLTDDNTLLGYSHHARKPQAHHPNVDHALH